MLFHFKCFLRIQEKWPTRGLNKTQRLMHLWGNLRIVVTTRDLQVVEPW